MQREQVIDCGFEIWTSLRIMLVYHFAWIIRGMQSIGLACALNENWQKKTFAYVFAKCVHGYFVLEKGLVHLQRCVLLCIVCTNLNYIIRLHRIESGASQRRLLPPHHKHSSRNIDIHSVFSSSSTINAYACACACVSQWILSIKKCLTKLKHKLIWFTM